MASFISSCLTELGRHALHTALEHAARYPGEHAATASASVLTAFLDAVVQRQYDAALVQCTHALAALIAQKGTSKEIDLLGTCLAAFSDVVPNKPESHPIRGECRMGGSFRYTSGQSGTYGFELRRTAQGWKVNGYQVEPLPDILRVHGARGAQHPGVPALESGACPAGYPIKGSRSGVFHVPGSRFYEVTRPILCFATEEEAVRAGYRACR